MSYRLKLAEADVYGKGRFANAQGRTECVEFVRQAAGAAPTATWRAGLHVLTAQGNAIARGTAIATFDEHGRYPSDGQGRHAAIYLGHDAHGIRVLDQWNDQGEVKPRVIHTQRAEYPRVNAAKHYYVIE
ncbi:MAG: BPSL0067 family protein [Inhella sp.]